MTLQFFDINNFAKEQYDYFYSILSPEKKEKVNRVLAKIHAYNSIEAEKRFMNIAKTAVAGEMLAREMIAEKLDISPEEIKFRISSKGKPYVENHNIFFNISHSHNMVVCGVSDREIGVDIEKIRPTDLKLAKRISTEKELEYIFDGNEPDYNSDNELYIERFFEIWTGKEAIFKYTGSGITDFKTVDTLTDSRLSPPMKKDGFIIRTAE